MREVLLHLRIVQGLLVWIIRWVPVPVLLRRVEHGVMLGGHLLLLLRLYPAAHVTVRRWGRGLLILKMGPARGPP